MVNPVSSSPHTGRGGAKRLEPRRNPDGTECPLSCLRLPPMPRGKGLPLARRRSDRTGVEQSGRHPRPVGPHNDVPNSSHKPESSRNGTAPETRSSIVPQKEGRSWSQVASVPVRETFRWSGQHEASERRPLATALELPGAPMLFKLLLMLATEAPPT